MLYFLSVSRLLAASTLLMKIPPLALTGSTMHWMSSGNTVGSGLREDIWYLQQILMPKISFYSFSSHITILNMSSMLNNGSEMVAQKLPLDLPHSEEVSEVAQRPPEPEPKMQAPLYATSVAPVITMEVEEPPQPPENREQEFRSNYGESDILSIVEDRNEWEKDHSEAEGKTKSVRKCFNKKCHSTKDLRKLKSRVVPSKYRNLCEACYSNYVNNQFCQFCEQIYDNGAFNEEDDHNWMGCDECERWNHVSCEFQKRNKDAYLIKQVDGPYLCVECANKRSQKIQNRRQKPAYTEEDYYQYQRPPNKKRTIRQIHNQERNQEYWNPSPNCVNIFGRPKEVNLYLDTFLHSINNYRLAISDNEIKEDLKRIREGSYKDKGLQGK